MTAHCEWCPFPGCDSCAYKGHERRIATALGLLVGAARRLSQGVLDFGEAAE